MKPSACELAVDEVERVVGQDDRGVLGHVVTQEVAVEVIAVDVGDVEVVGARELARVEVRLDGNGTQEAKYAGLNHGSQRIEP